jgi:(1->4)-alpha-D-glucan 1-alpha-D-glucosylmutase
MWTPGATYRIQLSPDFGFTDLAQILPYLSSLGITHIYASPIFKARPGSKHGYDIVDPNLLNPELGDETDFHELMSEVGRLGMGWLQDIVPNHMAFDSTNAMLMDVLENFKASEFFDYFDIDWDYHPGTAEPKLTVPFLARPYEESMKAGDISLILDNKGAGILYGDLRLPLRLATYSDLLKAAAALCGDRVPGRLADLARVFESLETEFENAARSGARAELLELYDSDPDMKRCLDAVVERANSGASDLSPSGMLHALLGKQVFRLVQWRSASIEINYRRFFHLSRFIALCMEVQRVFEHCHRLVSEWAAEGFVQGLRIDHIDGLYDATKYLARLRGAAPDAYLVTEKILAAEETLSPHWKVEGTTGYDFLNHVNGLFCMQANAAAFDQLYKDFTGMEATYDDIVYDNKRMIVETHFPSAVEKLVRMAEDLSRDMPDLSPSGHEGLEQALIGLIACFPVYRTYIGPRPPHPADRRRIEEAAREAARRHPETRRDLEALTGIILAAAEDIEDTEVARKRLRFVRTLQQYTGPVMAKGFEDTVLYVYNRLISLNEVGGEPADFGVSLDAFHAFNQRRLAEWPGSMSATSTHDAKRGEDVRARINVLSEMPREFAERIRRWRDLNARHGAHHEETRVPHPNHEYFLYQTLLGAHPFDQAGRSGFLPRLKRYMVKAMREAKSLTSWAEPDTAYEGLFTRFMEAILDPAGSSEFLDDFSGFAARVHRYGVYNSLSQCLLKMTSPGVPDFYQGAEVWDLNLVDPDNRRPVDFTARRQMLDLLAGRTAADFPRLLSDLLLHPEDGSPKLFLIHRVLAERARRGDLYRQGAYLPLYAEGRAGDHVVCFARRLEAAVAVVIAPRFFVSLVGPDAMPLGAEVWGDTRIALPGAFPAEWQDVVGGGRVRSEGSLRVADVLARFPVALLIA